VKRKKGKRRARGIRSKGKMSEEPEIERCEGRWKGKGEESGRRGSERGRDDSEHTEALVVRAWILWVADAMLATHCEPP
jgi:hypothetical protein